MQSDHCTLRDFEIFILATSSGAGAEVYDTSVHCSDMTVRRCSAVRLFGVEDTKCSALFGVFVFGSVRVGLNGEPTSFVECQCRMPLLNANVECQCCMPMLNDNVECQCRMPMSNANVECQCRMPMLHANVERQC